MSSAKTRISIITPCMNAEKYIRETVESVLGQTAVISGRVELEYVICDGSSTDGTVSIVESYGSERIHLISEPDAGLYEALAKGLRYATGDIVAYLNAGDLYNNRAFDVVLDIFGSKNVKWLTGYNTHYNEKSEMVYTMLPYRYRKELFACGLYGPFLPYVQQESTFWSSDMNALLDLDFLATLQYVGDYYLWLKFSGVADLKTVAAFLGGFRRHEGQLSTNLDIYNAEIRKLTIRPSTINYCQAFFDKIVWYFTPQSVKKSLNPKGLYVYDHASQTWV